jgi:hypothetical protein
MVDALLRWCNRNTRGYDQLDPVENWTDNWADGLAFCALLHTFVPDKIPMHELKTKTKEDKINNLKLAFRVGEELGAQALLDPEDVVTYQDERSIILYVSGLYEVLRDRLPQFFPSQEWIQKYEAKIEQKKLEEYQAKLRGESGTLGSAIPSSKGEAIFLKQQQATATETYVMSDDERKKRQLELEALAAERRKREEEQRAERERKRKEEKEKLEKIMRESANKPPPPTATVSSVAGWTVQLKGDGIKGTKVNTLTMFSAVIKENGLPPKGSSAENLKIEFNGPDKRINARVMDGRLGNFTIGFTPRKAGWYTLTFVFKGEIIADDIVLPVADVDGKVPGDPPANYTPPSETGGSVAASASTSTSNVSPSSPEKKSGDLTPRQNPTSESPSTPVATVTSRESKSSISVEEPQKLVPYASNCEVERASLKGITDTTTAAFTIVAKDKFGNRLNTGGDEFEVNIEGPVPVSPNVIDNKNGTYSVQWQPPVSGDYKISVKYKGVPISGCPFEVYCREGVQSGELVGCSFTFRLLNKQYKQRVTGGDANLLTVSNIGPKGNQKITVRDNDNGTYTLNCDISSGKNTIDVKLGGKSINGFPLVINVP